MPLGRARFLPPGCLMQGACSILSGSTFSAKDGDIVINSASLSSVNINRYITRTIKPSAFAANSATSGTASFTTAIPIGAVVIGAYAQLLTAFAGAATNSATRIHISDGTRSAAWIASADIHSGATLGWKTGPVGSALNSGGIDVLTAARTPVVKVMCSGGSKLSGLTSGIVVCRIMFTAPKAYTAA